MDLIKRWLNFGSCNFGLKSYLWNSNRTRAARSFDFEIEFQTKYCTPLSSITIKITCKKAVRLHNAQTKISGPFLESPENLLDPKSHL